MYISLNGFWGRPDLIVSSLGTNKITYRAGESLRITATTRNIGSSRVGYSYTKFYLSRDRYLNSSDTYLGSDYVSSLGAGSSSTDTMTRTLGGNLSGRYYLIAKADAYGWRSESNEGNNIRVLGPINITQAKPDLIVSSLGTNKTTYRTGESLRITSTTRNIGNASVGSSYTRFYLSRDRSLGSSDTYLGSDYVSSLGAGSSSTDTMTRTLGGNLSGRYYLIAKADAYGWRSESNEGNNIRVLGPINITQAKPDLIVSSLGTNKTTYRTGESLRITSTTRNIGNASVGSSYTRFYLSRDRSLGSSDTYLGSDYVSSLGAGSSSTDTMTRTLGGNLSGRYYLIAKADAYGWRSESNEGNNIRVLGPINITQAKPDLIVSSLGTNKTTYRTGESLRITSTTRNIGNASVGSSYTRFYLSRDRSLGSSDTYLGSDYVSSLGAGSSSTDTMTRTLGGNLSGRYYLIAKADAYGWRSESNEGNNIRVLGPINITQAKPDLIVTGGTARMIDSAMGRMYANVTVRNQGTGTAGSSYVGYYLSTNSTITTLDTRLSVDYTGSLASGRSEYDYQYFNLPKNLVAGRTYYIGAIADYSNRVGESNEGNNGRVLGSFIAPPPRKPDLVVTGGTARMIDSGTGRMYANVTVRNQGTGTAGSSYVGYYLSTNSTITTLDTRLSVDYTGSLASGRSEYDYQYFNLPKNLVAGRTYYIGAIADYSNRVGESNEGNNGRVLGSFIAPPPRKPDLVVTGGTARMIDSGTGRMYANVTVRNQGTGTAGSSYVGYYLSTNSTITTLDTRLSVDYTGSLASGRSEYDYQYFNLPKNLVAGRTYYIGAIADYSNRVGESNEGNNGRVLGSFIAPPPRKPDLVVTGGTARMIDSGTGRMYANVTVRNQGTGTAGSSYVGYYLSTNSTITTLDTRLSVDYTGSLASGRSEYDYQYFNLPKNLVAGRTYYIGAIADYSNRVGESNEGNNGRVLGSFIAPPPRKPDLVVTGGTARMIDSGTGRMYANVTVRNQGTGTAGSSYVGYYLSTNSTITTLDTRLSVDYTGSLASGRSEYDYQYFNLPKNLVAGRTYYIGAIADYSNRVGESNEGNNARLLGSFTVKPVNRAPVVTTYNKTVESGKALSASSLFRVTDADGDAMTRYEFRDGGAGGGYFKVDGVTRSSGQAFQVSASRLGSVRYHGGANAGSETLSVRAYDGKTWSAWKSLTATTTKSKVDITTRTHVVDANEQIRVSSLPGFVASGVSQLQFFDSNADGNSGYFKLGGARKSGVFSIAGSDLGNLYFVGGKGDNRRFDDLYVRAKAGSTWGEWSRVSIATEPHHDTALLPNHKPKWNGNNVTFSFMTQLPTPLSQQVVLQGLQGIQFTSEIRHARGVAKMGRGLRPDLHGGERCGLRWPDAFRFRELGRVRPCLLSSNRRCMVEHDIQRPDQ